MKAEGILVLDMSSKTPIADAVKKIVHREKMNYAILISGPPQIRKSSIGIKLSKEIDPNWDFEHDFAILKTREMMQTVSKKGPRGTVKFLDEIGVGLDHHVWYQFFQRAMSYIIQTYGFEGKIIIATVPYQDLVNKDILKFFNMWIEIIGKNEQEKYVVAKVKILQYNETQKEVYRKYPYGRYPDGTIKIMKRFRICFPEKEILEQYFEISNPQKKTLQLDLITEAAHIDRKTERAIFTPQKYANEIVKDPDGFMREYRGRKFISIEKIMMKFGYGYKRANQIKILAEEEIFGDKKMEG